MRQFAFRTGYDIGTDLHHGFTLRIGKLYVAFHFDKPHAIWYNKAWAVNEDGYLQGMPVRRVRHKRWLLRNIHWPRKWEFRWLSQNYLAQNRLQSWQ